MQISEEHIERSIFEDYYEFIWIDTFYGGFKPFYMIDLAFFLDLRDIVILDNYAILLKLGIKARNRTSLSSKKQLYLRLVFAVDLIVCWGVSARA